MLDLGEKDEKTTITTQERGNKPQRRHRIIPLTNFDLALSYSFRSLSVSAVGYASI